MDEFDFESESESEKGPEIPPFSKKWMLISFALFVGVEIVLGGVLGTLIQGGLRNTGAPASNSAVFRASLSAPVCRVTADDPSSRMGIFCSDDTCRFLHFTPGTTRLRGGTCHGSPAQPRAGW